MNIDTRDLTRALLDLARAATAIDCALYDNEKPIVEKHLRCIRQYLELILESEEDEE